MEDNNNPPKEIPRSKIVTEEETHRISTSYVDHVGKKQEATVILSINYRSQKYHIHPENGMEHFKFRDTSWKDANKWRAVAQAIQDAVDYAERQTEKKEVVFESQKTGEAGE